MNNVGGVDNNNQQILSQLNQRKDDKADDAGRSDFLKLLVAQLSNQNPLNPKEGGEFLSQLAQFSTVEGIEKLNGNFDKFANSQISNQALQATALVGRTVQVKSDMGELQTGKPFTGAVDLQASTSNLKLNIVNSSGSQVRQINLGSHAPGKVNFTWDGFDDANQPLPPGRYQVVADAKINGKTEQVPVMVNALVNSVTLASGGNVILNLGGGLGSVPLSEVDQIN